MTKDDTASMMLKLVQEFKASGQSRKVFAASHGIKVGKLQYWISKFAKTKRPDSEPNNSTQDFVPITLPSSTKATLAQHILIRLQSGVEIEIPL